jgi:hypothetical protein
MLIHKVVQDLDNTTLAKMADEIIKFKEKTGVLPDDAETRKIESLIEEITSDIYEVHHLQIAIAMIEREILKRFINLI